MDLETARKLYFEKKIEFKELDKIFWEKATKEQKEEFWNAPTFDRGWIVEGKNKFQRDAEFEQFINVSEKNIHKLNNY